MAGDGSIIIETQLDTDGLEKGLSNLKGLIEKGLEGAKTAFGKAFEDLGGGSNGALSEGMKNVISSAADAVKSGAAELGSAVRSAAENAAGEFAGREGEFRSGGESLISSARDGFSSGGPALGATAESVARQAAAKMRVDGEFAGVGQNLAAALRSGIAAGAAALYAKAAEIAARIVSTLKGAFKIHSPSAVFRDEIGKMLMLGLRDGILNNSEAVLAATEALAEDMLQSERRYLEEKSRIDKESDEEDEARRAREYEKKLSEAETLEEREELIEEERLRLRKRADSLYLEQLKTAAENERKIVDGLKDDITAAYKDIAEYIEDSLEPVEESRQRLEDRLKDYAADNSSGVRKIQVMNSEGDVQATYYSLADQRRSIDMLTRYARAMSEVTDRLKEEFGADTARDFMGVLAGMDVEEGALFAETLSAATGEDFRKYIEDWGLKNTLAEEISKQIYGEEFTDAVDQATEYMRSSLEKLGLEVPEGFFASGSLSAREFGRGFAQGIDEALEDARRLIESFGTVNGQIGPGGTSPVVNNNNYYSTYSVNGTRSTAAESIFAMEAAATMNRYRGLN